MKTRTLITAFTALCLCIILSAMQPSKNRTSDGAIQESSLVFNNIKIGEGIEVEFGYGARLQVLKAGYFEQPSVNMTVSNGTLTIVNLARDCDTVIRLKVVTPGLVGIAKLDPLHPADLASNEHRELSSGL